MPEKINETLPEHGFKGLVLATHIQRLDRVAIATSIYHDIDKLRHIRPLEYQLSVLRTAPSVLRQIHMPLFGHRAAVFL